MSRQNNVEGTKVMELYANIVLHIELMIADDPKVTAEDILHDLMEQKSSVELFARSED